MKQAKLISQIDELLDRASQDKLSEVVAKAYLLAKTTDDQSFEKWILLETSGYFETNPALTAEVLVPNYRKVPGQYHDKMNMPLIIDDPDIFNVVNNYHLREGIAELESISIKDGLMTFRNPSIMDQLKKTFGVEVDQFIFKRISVLPILHEIRNQLIAKLIELRKVITQKALVSGVETDVPAELAALHSIVQKVASPLYRDGHYRQAILDTYIALVDAVKTKSGRKDLDNTPLMQSVFSPKNPVLRISMDNDEQQGFMWLFSGAIMAIRNPKAHRLIQQQDGQRALEWLSFASVLLRVIDDAELENQ